jgi:hypothetical protein
VALYRESKSVPRRSRTFEADCVDTDASGHYQLTLPGADYRVYFSAFRNNLRYVSEWYDNARYYSEADLFHLGASENANLDVALVEGGSIGGTVTDESTEGPMTRLCSRRRRLGLGSMGKRSDRCGSRHRKIQTLEAGW